MCDGYVPNYNMQRVMNQKKMKTCGCSCGCLGVPKKQSDNETNNKIEKFEKKEMD